MKRSSGLSRIPSKLSESVLQLLNSYALVASAAGIGMLALASPAEAKIVYTATHHKLPLNKDFFLDLNHDGVRDFKFHIYTLDVNRRQTSSSVDSGFLFAYPQGASNQIIGKQPYAYALPAGVRVGPKGLFNKSRGTMGGVEGHSQEGRYLGPWADSGKPVDHRYLGLKFIINGKTHYGWARFNVRIYRNPESTINAVLTGYAYETIPNKPIITGQTKGMDEIERPKVSLTAPAPQPATLGMLAQGAPALSIWRREESVDSKSQAK
jgi:hypothetical protein